MFGQAAPPVPYVQTNIYTSSAVGTSHPVTFKKTPVIGNFLIIGFYMDATTTGTTPSGWTLVGSQPISTTSGLFIYTKIAGASEPTTVTFATGSTGVIATVFEMPIKSYAGTFDDDTGLLTNQGNATNAINHTVTSAADMIFAFIVYYNLTHNDTGDGPFTFDQGFSQISYGIALHGGTSGISLEMVVAYQAPSVSGTYQTNVTSTNLESGVFSPAIIISFK